MNQEIHFKGLSLTPDDTHTQPGELSLCANAELHDGALRPSVLKPTTLGELKNLGNIYTLLYVHKTSSGEHYIAYYKDSSTTHFGWFYIDNSTMTYGGDLFDKNVEAISASAIGKTLAILTDDGLYYVKWNGTLYKYLGQKPPFIELQFGISFQSEYKIDDADLGGDASDWYDIGQTQQDPLRCPVKESKQAEFTEKVFAKLNECHYKMTEDGSFYAPFFVRYAYRMYDNSLYMHSAPIFIPVGMPIHDFVMVGLGADASNPTSFSELSPNICMIHALAFKLAYRVVNNIQSQLQEWSDIISSIDIYLSPQFVRTKQDEIITTVGCSDDYSMRLAYSTGDFLYGLTPLIYEREPLVIMNNVFKALAYLPLKEMEDYCEEISSPVFYKVHSFKLEETLPTTFTNFPISDKLVNLTTLEQMEDEYKSHNMLLPSGDDSGLYLYNKRLNFFSVNEKLFEGFYYKSMAPFSDSTCWRYYESAQAMARRAIPYRREMFRCWVRLNTEDGEKVTKVEDSLYVSFSSLDILKHVMLYYPDARAYEMVIEAYDDGGTYKIITLPMKQSMTLNGSFTTLAVAESNSGLNVTFDNICSMPNKLYVSKVDNPFVFPLEGVNTIGSGSIIGVANVTKAMSPGQRGIADLLVFCTDGIWTLKVSSTGTYANAELVSNEVCENKRSICQLNQSVLFATKRGLAKIVGEDVASISEALDGPQFPIVTKMPQLVSDTLVHDTDGDGNLLFECTVSGVATVVYTDDDGETWKDEESGNVVTPDDTPEPKMVDSTLTSLLRITGQPFSFFVDKDTRVIYDFANSRILILSTKSGSYYAYVYSIKDGAWSTMYIGDCLTTVNGYPDPYLQRTDGTLLKLENGYNYTDTSTTDSLVLTRSLAYADTMQVIQGFQQINDSLIVPTLYIYGSNDNVNWRFVGKAQRNHAPYLPGTPFRWFRIAIRMKMAPKEKYSKLLLNVIEKYQKL